MEKRYNIFFSGTVQGVGFRYTAKALADKYALKGWAMNIPNGNVELEIEGFDTDLNSFLEDLKGEFKNYIEKVDLKELAHCGEYKDFRIRFY